MKRGFNFESKVLAAFAAAALVVALLAAVTWKLSHDALQAAASVSRTQEVLAHIARARSQSYLIELTTQSYRISGDEAQLAERNVAISSREVALRRIKELTADNPRQLERWKRLRETADERLAISRRVELLRRTEGSEAANAYAARAPLRETRERLVQLMDDMGAEELRLLDERNAEQDRAREFLATTGALAGLALIALLTATYALIRRQMRATEAARRALAESEENLSTTLHSIGDAVLATDTEGRVTRMNPVAERLTGWPSAEAQGRPVDEVFRIINEQTRASAVVPVAKVLETGEIQGLANHTVLIARDGTEWPIADSAAPIRDALGRVSGVVLVFRDVSAERQAERTIREQNALLEQRVRDRTAQLRASEAHLRSLIDNVPALIAYVDAQQRYVYVNDGYRKLFAPGQASVDGRTAREVLGEERYAIAAPRIAKVLQGEAQGYDWQPSPDVWQMVKYVPQRDAQGRVAGYYVLISDITERKQAEQEIRDLNASLERRVAERTAQLEEANRAKSDFLANMSHELRTPLNAIIGFSEMLKDGLLGELDAKQSGFVADIFNAGTHLLALINDILDLSKVEAGMMRLEADALDLPALLQSSLLMVREKAADHRIRLTTDLDPGLGTIAGDERKVKQIVYNLLANAVKFSPDGGAVTLSARRCSRAAIAAKPARPSRLLPLPPGEDHEFIEICVEDAGAGIAEEDLPKLFEPFMQVDSSAARRQQGTGLGLAMVRRLAELHGGTVGVASRRGAGSVFSVWLPYRAFAEDTQEAKAPPTAEPAARADRPLAVVIEDDDRMAGLIERALRGEGYDTMRAATAEEGLARAAKRPPDLITLDIFLPEMDGWEFLRRLKAHPTLGDTPVVIITVSQEADRGLALGARRVLQKPFTRAQLAETLAGLIEVRPNGEAARVLVVDDNVKAVELVATALEADGYRVMRAYGGAEAIEVARRARPDLVILDLLMPEVSGFEVASTLRASEDTAHIPILVLTAKDLTAEDRARLNSEVSAILQKSSFSRSDLLAELRRALPKRGGG